jgi:hypothetical protein
MPEDHPFAPLAGTWLGTGHGEYPTIADFTYREELIVIPVPGRPVAHWRSTTRDAETGEPRHAESGFLRATPSGVELVLAHSFGVAETAVGAFDGEVLSVEAGGLLGTPSAKRVDEVDRRYVVGPDVLRYDIAMGAVGVPLTHHLSAELHRT